MESQLLSVSHEKPLWIPLRGILKQRIVVLHYKVSGPISVKVYGFSGIELQELILPKQIKVKLK